ncbi:MAG: 2Fe-2S iron-sulfur cluster-binding protein [Rhodanobacter sp.]
MSVHCRRWRSPPQCRDRHWYRCIHSEARNLRPGRPQPDLDPVDVYRNPRADWPPIWLCGRETVLEAAQRAGVALPYSCRAGVCGRCKAALLKGECIDPRNSPVGLSAHALANGAVVLSGRPGK